ncbi:carboxypeptidase M-like [Oppia nitens]|uniref:carboxypeptidase M-like n=1 Tax=Oppia nitens TaxID=1686743 RepID=UPI0023DC6952|nr:carboxypeptidase M-like [Oppia nitens]
MNYTLIIAIILSFISVIIKSHKCVQINYVYHNYTSMTAMLKSINQTYPELVYLYSIGQSVQGRELWVMLITNDPGNEVLLKPNVKYVANMHGNEVVGRELMLHLIAYLLNSSDKSKSIKNMLNTTRIHIMPSMNPDGFETGIEGKCEGPGRFNAENRDLNRNFPDFFQENTRVEQSETEAVRKWLHRIPFVLSANFHGGTVVVNYPYDNNPFGRNKKSVTPDNDVFKHLSLTYVKKHPKMKNSNQCSGNNRAFDNGIVNGAEWYPVKGGMQDYNYIYAGCMEITVELSCCKYPRASALPNYWNDNRQSLIAYLQQVHKGVKGLIRDQMANNPIPNAEIKIVGREITFRSTARGEYYRILMPGDYVIEAKAKGFVPIRRQFTVVDNRVTKLNLYMYRQNEHKHRGLTPVSEGYTAVDNSYGLNANQYLLIVSFISYVVFIIM